MNFRQASQSLLPPAVYVKNRAKDVLRSFLPAQVRFVRSGEVFMVGCEREMRELSRLVEVGSTTVDIGAHIGEYTYALCRHVGPKGHVIAVEPIPDLARMISRATSQLGLPVTVHNCALSSHDGEAKLLIPVQNGKRLAGFATLERRAAPHGRSQRVSLRQLDRVCENVPGRISFIKIDVEGHELEVLRGGIQTLKRQRPNLLVEIEERHSTVPISETFEFLASLNYAGEFWDAEGTCRPLSCFDVVEHQRRRISQMGTSAYINNFVFQSTGPLH